MSKSLFLFSSTADETDIITASSAVLPVTNIQNSQRTKPWRSGAGTTSNFSFTLSNPSGVDTIALIDMNLTTAGGIRIQAWDDAVDGSTSTLDVTISPTLYTESEEAAAYGDGLYGVGLYGLNTALEQLTGKNITLYSVGSTILSAYWKFTFTDANTSYQQLGRLMMGSATEFTYNLSLGYQIARTDRSVAREAIGGQRYTQPRPGRLSIGGRFPYMPDVERTAFLIQYQVSGNSLPFVYSIYPEATNKGLTTTMYGRFENADMSEEFFQATTLDFSVIEEL